MPRVFRFLALVPVAFAVVLGLTSDAAAVDPLLRRSPGAWFYGPTAVWTDATAGGAFMFHPLSEPIPSAGLLGVRVSYQLSEDTGSCQLRAALRYSDDGINWETPKEIYTAWQDGNGVKYQQDYVDIIALSQTPPRTWVQFGVQTDTDTGVNAVHFAKAAIRVEPKQR